MLLGSRLARQRRNGFALLCCFRHAEVPLILLAWQSPASQGVNSWQIEGRVIFSLSNHSRAALHPIKDVSCAFARPQHDATMPRAESCVYVRLQQSWIAFSTAFARGADHPSGRHCGLIRGRDRRERRTRNHQYLEHSSHPDVRLRATRRSSASRFCCLYLPTCTTRNWRILSGCGSGERIDHYPTQRLHKGGQRIEISVAVSPIRDAENRFIGSALIARDIGDRNSANRPRMPDWRPSWNPLMMPSLRKT